MVIRNKWTVIIAAVLVIQAILSTISTTNSDAAVASADNTTKFRVYHNDAAMKEFAAESSAVAYAKQFTYTHVEKIANREWVWDNLPKYKVYENGVSSSGREFRTLTEAQRFASKVRFAQIRDLEKPGFIQSNYPNFQMYQGDKTLANWSFVTLADAKKAAKAYGNIHIIELATNQWVWDNLTDAQKAAQRKASLTYSIVTDSVQDSAPAYSFLLDAIRASFKVPGSSVVNRATGQIVHSNIPTFTVVQSGPVVASYHSIQSAIQYAKSLSGASVVKNGLTWWTNVPYLAVYQGDQKLRSFHTRKGAIEFANTYAGSTVMSTDLRAIWNNKKSLQLLGWNGTSRTSTVLDQVGKTQGLDIDSPSWFELASADGTFTDTSDPALVQTMKASGIKLTPLVSNQFDAVLTSAFLRNETAKNSFITNLVSKLTALDVEGVNIDFEGMAGKDRDLYTAFVRSFTSAAHKAGLTVSVDLPRGDVKWDAKTAYDQRALAEIVDMIMIMAYDQHWKGSDEAGSVAELTWVEDGVKQFLAYGVPRSKLMLGIPFYVREWRIDATGKLVDNKAIFMSELPRIIAEQGATRTFDATAGQWKYEYTGQDGYTHVFWAETADTVKARVNIAKKYDLAGVAAWRLGYEQADLWTMLLQMK
ncbi:glycosyl hydrolase family 18 protein [Paenibacillus sp. BC26]|uniref:glycosyl hydrolase family 18 protein n=1 Tax=Paenibacillus sp. BC26 TaxID=1881032 RepID=UPI0008EBF510|nr:glycosyl hydrolase family 18 protein [Paenibacillus sp. BC26]SFS61870.1 Spore germination protein YaaH [Paenibacillus sp. BC26]